jgi:hypothetical protein
MFGHYNWFYEKHYETSKTPSSEYIQAASFFGVIITQIKVVIHLFIPMIGGLEIFISQHKSPIANNFICVMQKTKKTSISENLASMN